MRITQWVCISAGGRVRSDPCRVGTGPDADTGKEGGMGPLLKEGGWLLEAGKEKGKQPPYSLQKGIQTC